MYAYQTFNTHFRVLARVLTDVLGPTACGTHFSGKVFLISTVCIYAVYSYEYLFLSVLSQILLFLYDHMMNLKPAQQNSLRVACRLRKLQLIMKLVEQ